MRHIYIFILGFVACILFFIICGLLLDVLDRYYYKKKGYKHFRNEK